MKTFFIIIALLVIFSLQLFAQDKTAAEYGFKHIQLTYLGDLVDILIKSKKGEEQIPKPLFLFCQGSQPKPLIIYDEIGQYGVFPFSPDSLTNDYHLAIVGKPYIPFIADKNTLDRSFMYLDSAGRATREYSDRNLLEYYVERNKEVIQYLQEQSWIDKKRLVVAGHSEGSVIGAKMASELPQITHVIYSGGNPLGRILSILQEGRADESDTDSTKYGERTIDYWKEVVKNKDVMVYNGSDTDKATYGFSLSNMPDLEHLNIPVLVTYGTKDWGAPYNDYLQIEMIRQGKDNFSFKAYIGAEHNYFPLLPDGKPNYEIFNWDLVAYDWLKWLRVN